MTPKTGRIRRLLEKLPRPTGAGLFYVLIVGLVLYQSSREPAPAIQNLLIMVGAALGSFLLAGAVLGSGALRRIRVARQLPSVAEVGQPIAIGVSIHNQSRVFPAGVVEVHQPEARGIGFRNSIDAAMYCGPSSTERLEHGAVFLRRGDYSLGPLRLSTAFPFGLVRQWRTVELDDSVLVWPRRTVIPPWLMQRISSAALGLHTAARIRGSDEIYGLREYAPGDPVTRIHWATTARAGTPMLLELEGLGGQRCLILLDTGEGDGVAEPPLDAEALLPSLSSNSATDTARSSGKRARSVESLVSIAAGLLSELHAASRPVGLSLMDGDLLKYLPVSHGTRALHEGMTTLARCRAAQQPLDQWIGDALSNAPRDTLIILVTARNGSEIPSVLSKLAGGCVLVSLHDPMVQHAVEASRFPLRSRDRYHASDDAAPDFGPAEAVFDNGENT